MQIKDFIQVLWVENDPVVIEAYPLEAEEYGVQLVPFSCFDDAYTALREDYNRWDAIILDAKCKVKETDVDKAIPFLTQSTNRIAELAKDNNKTIKWYILSGQGEEAISDAIPDTRLAWDRDWTDSTNKKFYSKETDRGALFTRIKEHYCSSLEFQIKNDIYKNVFISLENLGISEFTESILLDILLPLHYPEKQVSFKPVHHYTQLRILIEYLFRACYKVGLVPDQCVPNGLVNLNQCLMYLSGKPAEVAGVRYGGIGEKIIPEYIEQIIHSVLSFGNVHSHTVKLENEDIIKIENILHSSQSNFLIFGLMLQLCEVITWLAKYVSVHDDKEINLFFCTLLKIEKDILEKYEGQEFVLEKDENGLWHCGECWFPKSSWNTENMLQIDKLTPNLNPDIKYKYPYYIAKYKPVKIE